MVEVILLWLKIKKLSLFYFSGNVVFMKTCWYTIVTRKKERRTPIESKLNINHRPDDVIDLPCNRSQPLCCLCVCSKVIGVGLSDMGRGMFNNFMWFMNSIPNEEEKEEGGGKALFSPTLRKYFLTFFHFLSHNIVLFAWTIVEFEAGWNSHPIIPIASNIKTLIGKK